MSDRHENRGMTPWPIRTIQVGGHQIPRQAFEQYVVDRKAVSPGGLRHPRVEWTPILRQTADQRQHPRSHLGLSCLRQRPVADGSNRAGAFMQLPLRKCVEL